MMSEEGDIDDIVDSALRGFWQSVKSESKVSQSQAAPPIFAAAGLGHAGVSDLPPGGMKEELEKLARLSVDGIGTMKLMSMTHRSR